MSQIGVKCVRGLVKHADCRACSIDPMHPCALPPDLLELMRQSPDDYHADPDAFSPTGLLDCDRKEALISKGNWYLDVDKAWPMTRGTLTHSIMEANGSYPGAVGIIREQVMEVEVDTRFGKQRLVGKPDLVVVQSLDNGTAHLTIVDYKSTSEIGHDLTAAKHDHVRQVNMYGYLVKRWLPEHYSEPLTVEVAELSIVYLDFKKVRRFTSAGWLEARGKRLSLRPLTYDTLDLEPIKIYEDTVIERGIKRMIENKIAARTTLPPAYQPDDDEYWRCGYCPVREECAELEMRGV